MDRYKATLKYVNNILFLNEATINVVIDHTKLIFNSSFTEEILKRKDM